MLVEPCDPISLRNYEVEYETRVEYETTLHKRIVEASDIEAAMVWVRRNIPGARVISAMGV